jgi:hypothetical protein
VKTRRRPSTALLIGGAGVAAAAILAVAILRRPALESETVLEPRPVEQLHPAPPPPVVQPPAPPPVHDKIVIGSDGQSKVIPAPAGDGARPPRVVETGAEQHRADSPASAPVATSAGAPADAKTQKKPGRERPPVTAAEARRKPAKAGHRAGEEEGAAAGVQAGQTNPAKTQAPAPPEPPVPLGPTNSAL